MRLSEHFDLEEFLFSQTAIRNGIDMTPSEDIIKNLKRLCETVLEPLRVYVDSPIRISSGYRPPVLNDLIGGSKTSAHRFGRAADFTVIGQTPFETVQSVLALNPVFDQVIHEFGRWVHVGIAELPRYEVLTAIRENGVTRYIRGLSEV